VPGLTTDTPGELLHKLGEEGARRAKVWLDATTRVKSSWSAYDKGAPDRLTYPWPEGGKSYSYDLGGNFLGGDLENQFFLAECKKYSTDQQGDHFDKFLAQSYSTLERYPYLADHFLWITWHPFRVTKWNTLYDESAIRRALVTERARLFGDAVGEGEVGSFVNDDIVSDLAKRIWIIVLSDRQETLVISNDDRAELMKVRILKEGN
jgi:hypothetical protein